MKIEPLIFLLLFQFSVVAASNEKSLHENENIVIAGVGWGKIVIGEKKVRINQIFGKPMPKLIFTDNNVNAESYDNLGLEVLYNDKNNTVEYIGFNRKDTEQGFYTFKGNTFLGRTDKDISMNSSVNDVIKAYGEPIKNYKGKSWQRLVYDGISFKFSNNRMVHIGVSKKRNIDLTPALGRFEEKA